MRPSWIVFAKEVVDHCRDRRALLSTLLFGPLIGPLIFALASASAVETVGKQLDRTIELPVVGAERAPNLVAFVRQQGAQVIAAPDDPEDAVRRGTHDVVLVIPRDFPERFAAARPASVRLIVDHSERQASASARRVRSWLRAYSTQIGRLRLMVRGVHPSAIEAIALETQDVSTPKARSVHLLGMLPYFLIFAILLGAFHLAIDATAGERERGSLEVLLASPVRRSELVLGKLAATCVFALLSLVMALFGFGISLSRVPLEEIGLTSSFGLSEITRIFAVTVPFALLGAALLMVVAAFAKTVREAQTYLSALILIPMAPIFLTILSPVRPRLWMMLIPSLSQHLLITDVLKGSTLEVLAVGTSVASTLLLTALATWVAARLYAREAILG
jgi:sodium transport system permease protein